MCLALNNVSVRSCWNIQVECRAESGLHSSGAKERVPSWRYWLGNRVCP